MFDYKYRWRLADATEENEGATLTPSNVAVTKGIFGKGYNFTATTSYMLTENVVSIPDSFSVSVWARATASTGNRMIFALNSASFSGVDIFFSGSSIYWNIGDGTANPFKNGINNVTQPSINVWHHYAIINSKTRGKAYLYVDGIYHGEATYRSGFQDNRRLTVGNYISGDLNYGWIGQIEDLRLYARELTLKEVVELSKPLLCHLTFREKQLKDVSGFNHQLTVTSGLEAMHEQIGRIGRGCQRFDRIQDIQFPFTMSTLTNCTISFWRKSIDAGHWMVASDANAAGSYCCAIGSGNFYSTNHPTNIWVDGVARTTDIRDGNWHFYVFSGIDLSAWNGFTLTRYTGWGFHGFIDDLRIYNKPLTQTEAIALQQTQLSIDNKGQLHCKELHAFKDKNIVDYTNWVVGTTGSQPTWTANGSSAENSIVEDLAPNGTKQPIWLGQPSPAGEADGGFNGTYYNIDNTKMHRFSVWIRRTVIGNGTFYHGLSAVLNRSNGVANSNPYFNYDGWTRPANEWFLFVGHLYPAGSGTGGSHPDSGVYDINGNKVGNSLSDYTCSATTTSVNTRAYLYYSTDTSTRQQFFAPRIDCLDGTEPSIQSLCKGYDEYVSSYFRNSLISYPQNTNSGIHRCEDIDELGVSSGLIAYYPFTKRSLNDFSETKSALTPYGSVVFNEDREEQVAGFLNTAGAYLRGDVTYSATSFTICMWVKIIGNASGSTLQIFYSHSLPYMAMSDNGVTPYYSYTGAGVQRVITSPVNITHGQWAHHCFVSDATGVKMYVDGVLRSSLAIPCQDTATVFDIGRHLNESTYRINGYVGDVRFYNRPLSAEEVARVFDSFNKFKLGKETTLTKRINEV